jgi:hypothetical protein
LLLGNNRVFFSDTNGNGFISMSEVSQAVAQVEVPPERREGALLPTAFSGTSYSV